MPAAHIRRGVVHIGAARERGERPSDGQVQIGVDDRTGCRRSDRGERERPIHVEFDHFAVRPADPDDVDRVVLARSRGKGGVEFEQRVELSLAAVLLTYL